MKTTPLLTALAAMIFFSGSASANVVTNGDFSSNAAGFGAAFPGYRQAGGPNPAEIDNWTHSLAGNAGINGVGLHNPFGPSDKSAATYYAFVQGAGSPGSTLSQTISLAPNTTYDISFLAAARASNPNASGTVTVADNSTTYYTSGNQAWSNAAFQAVAAQFSTGASFDGPVVIRLANTSPAGDNTVVYSNVVITPEPSSLALLGLGGLLVARRRR